MMEIVHFGSKLFRNIHRVPGRPKTVIIQKIVRSNFRCRENIDLSQASDDEENSLVAVRFVNTLLVRDVCLTQSTTGEESEVQEEDQSVPAPLSTTTKPPEQPVATVQIPSSPPSSTVHESTLEKAHY